MFKKVTFFIFFSFGLLFSGVGYSQSVTEKNPSTDSNDIENLSVYPNPVSNGKLYIVTKENFTKQIAIFNVLGKQIFSASLSGNELNISKLKAGVYILKVTENNISATRKLIVK